MGVVEAAVIGTAIAAAGTVHTVQTQKKAEKRASEAEEIRRKRQERLFAQQQSELESQEANEEKVKKRASDQARKRLLASQQAGRRGTINTSPLGVGERASVARKTLGGL